MLKYLIGEHCYCYIILWISIKEKKTELGLFIIYEHAKVKILQAHAHGRTEDWPKGLGCVRDCRKILDFILLTTGKQ